MKLTIEEISDQSEIKKIKELIESETKSGKLYAFQKENPDAYIVVAPDKMKSVDYFGSIFAKNATIIGRFSIVKDTLMLSTLMTK